MRNLTGALVFLMLQSLCLPQLAAQVPPDTQWIWIAKAAPALVPPNGIAWFQVSFHVSADTQPTRLGVAADNHALVWVNGKHVLRTDDWSQSEIVDISAQVRVGSNLLCIQGRNDSGPAGLLFFVQQGAQVLLRSNNATRCFSTEPTGWPNVASDAGQPAALLGMHGAAPWGSLQFSASRTLLPADGFEVTQVAEALGSLIALAIDNDGAPVVSVESGGLLKLVDSDGDGYYEASTNFCSELRVVQGIAFLSDGCAWATGIGAAGPGLYKLPPANGPRSAILVAPVSGDMGEHGAHAVVPTADGRLYLILGNHVQYAGPLAADSPCDTVYEGHSVARILDPNGHATHVRAPGGTVITFDPASGRAERHSCGYRNAYDAAVAPDGSLFVFDSDMEWDIGMPWYRPVRLLHAVPGGDYGWRTGSAKSPAWHADTLPPSAEVGRGSPTGVCWCDSELFPTAWRRTLLAADWSQGRVLAFNLTPDGTTWKATARTLLSGRPLPVSDMAFDREGGLLLALGGRGTRGGLLRLRGITPGPSPAPKQRQALPHYDQRTSMSTLVAALSLPDRNTRYAAARELSRRTPASVAAIAATHPLPSVRAELLVALARGGLARGDATVRKSVPHALHLMGSEHSRSTRLAAARALQLLLDAGWKEPLDGMPRPEPEPMVGADLAALFPSKDAALDRDLALLLSRCAGQDARAELLQALATEASAEESLHLLYALSAIMTESDDATLRPAFVRIGTLRTRPGGASYQGFLDAMQRRMLQQVPEMQRTELAALASAPRSNPLVLSAGAPRREKSRIAEYLQLTDASPERDAHEGARVFARACAACHRRGELGNAAGPDLSTVAARMGRDDLLTAIMEPSRHVSDQYRTTQLFTKDQQLLSGLVLRDDGNAVELLDREGVVQRVPALNIEERRFSPLSAMPDGLLDGLSLSEIADLFATLLGDPVAAQIAHAPSAWQALLPNGLEGCSGELALWNFTNGTLTGSASGLTQNSFLLVPGEHHNFLLEAEVHLPTGNSGIQFRSAFMPNGTVRGFQADMGDQWWGSLYEEQGRGVLQKADALLFGPSLQRDGWNHMLIEARGTRVRIVLNGLETVALDDPASDGGRIAFQLHQGPPMNVSFRNLRLRKSP
ncbi:MAG: DUF1080 domain-containing protein [Planctomycetes bacterium]|nr:DUF1080 domain-containing protein [Planctomycetota bacterium]